MESLDYEDFIKKVTEITKELIERNQLEEALGIVQKFVSPISNTLEKIIIMNKASYNRMKEHKMLGIITSAESEAREAQIMMNLLTIIIEDFPRETKIQPKQWNIKPSTFETIIDKNREKIQGPMISLERIDWMAKGQDASKSVCQVVRPDGRKGTGFVLKDGYLLTNWYLINSKELAASSKIIFNYEEDLSGNLQKTSEYDLELDDCTFSPIREFDYAYIKIKDNPANPLSLWGYLELETVSEPQIDDIINIIHHPFGNTKQFAMGENKIIGINGHKLLYKTETNPGSGGSPVFNNDWKVIALHEANKSGVREGILIKYIIEHIGKIK